MSYTFNKSDSVVRSHVANRIPPLIHILKLNNKLNEIVNKIFFSLRYEEFRSVWIFGRFLDQLYRVFGFRCPFGENIIINNKSVYTVCMLN